MMIKVFLFTIFILSKSCPEAALVRRSLDGATGALCMDGTPGAYYHTYTDDEDMDTYTNYVIFLQGGGYCHYIDGCHWRCGVAPNLCTTSTSPDIPQHGILSDDPNINPGFHDYYKVDLPYCTGDMYVGERTATPETEGYSFLGRQVFDAMIFSLKTHTGIDKANNVILSGSSAGGAGVVFNCDHLKSLLPEQNIFCVVDGAFFYPVDLPIHNSSSCDPIDDVLERGAVLWNTPEVLQFALHADWWRTIQQPLFIGSARYDRFGIESYCGEEDNWNDLITWGTGTLNMARRLMRDCPKVGIYMPACLSHMMLTDEKIYNNIPVGKSALTYARALSNWVHTSGPVHAVDTCVTSLFCNELCEYAMKEKWWEA